MDTARRLDDRMDQDDDVDGVGDDRALDLDIGSDERRMHVRAYNHWVSLLSGRPYPSIEDLDPENIADFGPNSVLLDFSQGMENPEIRFLGRALREECGVGIGITHIAQVPSRSLLSRLTDHYLQIIANRAPIGFEAEFVGQRGHNTMYRGILMPFSSDEDSIDFIYGVINWKELADAETQASLNAELAAARRAAPRAEVVAPVWADGPSGGFDATGDQDETLWGSLARARETAAEVTVADGRSRAALYQALGRAYDFALATAADADGYRSLLETEGLVEQARAPMTPIVKLVFGADYPKARVTEFAAVLSHAERLGLGRAMLTGLLDAVAGGIKAVVKAERDARRPAAQPDRFDRAAAALRSAPALATLPMVDAQGEEFVVLLARASREGGVEIVARVEGGRGLIRKLVRDTAG